MDKRTFFLWNCLRRRAGSMCALFTTNECVDTLLIQPEKRCSQNLTIVSASLVHLLDAFPVVTQAPDRNYCWFT